MALDRTVWDRHRDPEWFGWKYRENPYLDDDPVFVAERDGSIVGARPIQVFRVRTPTGTMLALQPSDTMVHPDHRRQGLFTRMTQRALEYYEPREPELFFNFPNDDALGGYQKLGWQSVAPRRAYYRIQNPTAFLRKRLGGDPGAVVGAVATPATRGFYHLRRRLDDPITRFEITRQSGTDPEFLQRLYEREVPDTFHALRDSEFYEWIFDSPAWNHHTAVARSDGDVVAALVSRTRTTDGGITVTQIAEVAPLVGGDQWRDAVSALIDRTIEAAADADLVSTVRSGIPEEVLARHGLYPGSQPPIEQLRGSSATFVVRPVRPEGADSWQIDGRDLTDRSNWLLTFCEHDTA